MTTTTVEAAAAVVVIVSRRAHLLKTNFKNIISEYLTWPENMACTEYLRSRNLIYFLFFLHFN
jgi:hypothetical protein